MPDHTLARMSEEYGFFPGFPLFFTLLNARDFLVFWEAGNFFGSPPGWAQDMASDHSYTWFPGHSPLFEAFSLKFLSLWNSLVIMGCCNKWQWLSLMARAGWWWEWWLQDYGYLFLTFPETLQKEKDKFGENFCDSTKGISSFFSHRTDIVPKFYPKVWRITI